MRKFFLLGAALSAAAPLFAQGEGTPPGQTAQGDVAVTIYNNNRALVEDKRTLNLPAGRSRQEFRDVSAQIQPETVTLNGRGVGIVEQNFDFDLLTPTALMQNAVGQEVTLVRVNPASGQEVRERARVLAANGASFYKSEIGSRSCATTACRRASSSTRCRPPCAHVQLFRLPFRATAVVRVPSL